MGDDHLNSSKALNCLACCWLGKPVSTWQVEMGWPDIHWLTRDKGGLVAAIDYEFGMSSSLPLEPELAPCGWHCPHRRPTMMGPFGNGN
jgi:hypothetical protein